MASFHGEALRRGLEGWVRNRRDGSVEAVFAGPANVVADLVARCRRGPSTARVEAVAEEPTGLEALNQIFSEQGTFRGDSVTVTDEIKAEGEKVFGVETKIDCS